MTEPEIDYTALFRALPGMVALLTPQLVYADANEEFLRLTGRTREQVIGRYLPDAFPELPDDPIAAIRRNVQASLRRVAETGERDAIALQRYDVEDPGRPGYGRSGTGAGSTPRSSARTVGWRCCCTGWRRSPSSSAPARSR